MSKLKFPDDLYANAIKNGTRWYGTFRVPWRAKAQFVKESGVVVSFDNELSAFKAATIVMTCHFKDETDGWAPQAPIELGIDVSVSDVFEKFKK